MGGCAQQARIARRQQRVGHRGGTPEQVALAQVQAQVRTTARSASSSMPSATTLAPVLAAMSRRERRNWCFTGSWLTPWMKCLSIFTYSGRSSDHSRRLEKPSPRSSMAMAKPRLRNWSAVAHQLAEVVGRLVLGELDDDLVRGEAQFPQLFRMEQGNEGGVRTGCRG